MIEHEPELEQALDCFRVARAKSIARTLAWYLDAIERNRSWAGLVSRGFAERPVEMVADSIGAAAILAKYGKSKAADLGAGGGLLGIVVAACCPEIDVTLIESSSRKASFMAECVGAMELGNVRVANARAQDLGEGQRFDLVMSRAAGPLAKVLPPAFGLLDSGGLYAGLKSSAMTADSVRSDEALEEAGGKLLEVHAIRGPWLEGDQPRASLVVLQKV